MTCMGREGNVADLHSEMFSAAEEPRGKLLKGPGLHTAHAWLHDHVLHKWGHL